MALWPKSRTSLYSGSFSCSASRLWNALPQSVREAGSLNSFKKSLNTIIDFNRFYVHTNHLLIVHVSLF